MHDLEFKIIYSLVFYIPFNGEKNTRKRRKSIRLFRFSKHEFSLLESSQCQQLLLEFCVSNGLYKKSLQHKRNNDDRMNNKREFRSLRKFACTTGARGFRQTVVVSFNMSVSNLRQKKFSVDFSSLARRPTVFIKRMCHIFMYHSVKLCSHHKTGKSKKFFIFSKHTRCCVQITKITCKRNVACRT